MNILQQFEEGKMSACEAYVSLKAEEERIKDEIEIVRQEAIKEASTFNKGEVYHGFVWEIRSGRRIYDFTQDDVFMSLDAQLKARRKELTEAAKAKENNKVFFDSETGEQVEAVPLKSVTSDILVFKLPKR